MEKPLPLKSARQPDFESAFVMLKRRIAEEFRRHKYAAEKLEGSDQRRFNLIMNETDQSAQYLDALAFLSRISAYHVEGKQGEAREWYDGYQFGRTEVYNPWSVINYVKDISADYEAFPKPYWANTSSNSIVRELVERADAGVRQEMESLIEGGTIEKPVHEDITYDEVYRSEDNLWNFLFFTGYLKNCLRGLTGKRFT